jgi:hypothetical protein
MNAMISPVPVDRFCGLVVKSGVTSSGVPAIGEPAQYQRCIPEPEIRV